eukprot:2679041-Prymnesium_polylepis.1
MAENVCRPVAVRASTWMRAFGPSFQKASASSPGLEVLSGHPLGLHTSESLVIIVSAMPGAT